MNNFNNKKIVVQKCETGPIVEFKKKKIDYNFFFLKV